jgi:phytoene dehydrogenase-like protein
MLDAVVVGSGPNGLTAAITLAEAGLRVLVLEANAVPGGGARTEERTLPGVRHDVCSAVHPFGVASPAFTAMNLEEHALRWAHPEIPFAHPLDGGRAAAVTRDIEETCERLGGDGQAWRRTVGWVVRHWEESVRLSMSPPLQALRRPMTGGGFGWRALRSAAMLVRHFRTVEGRAAIAGLAAHAAVPLTTIASAGVAISLGASAHTVGWPVAVGGSGAITEALIGKLHSLGGEIRVGTRVERWSDIPEAALVILDAATETAVRIAGDRMSSWRRRRYRSLPRGPGVFKIDVAVDGPIPWSNEDCRRAGTLHLGGTYEEIAESERTVADGGHPARPFVIAAQPAMADPTRAPSGTHVLWAYCRVPHGSTADMTAAIVGQVERFAPGFESRIMALSARAAGDLEKENANLVGGDITGGTLSLRGLFARPTLVRPYRAARGVYLCSASTPPGAGVHGMCGWHAAHVALKDSRPTVNCEL